MRKLFAALLVATVLLGVGGTALAENGSIWPWNTVKSFNQIRAMENPSIWPF